MTRFWYTLKKLDPFSNMDLVWTPGMRHKHANKTSIEIAYIPHAHVSEFLEGE